MAESEVAIVLARTTVNCRREIFACFNRYAGEYEVLSNLKNGLDAVDRVFATVGTHDDFTKCKGSFAVDPLCTYSLAIAVAIHKGGNVLPPTGDLASASRRRSCKGY
jgi:hypothetical protein